MTAKNDITGDALRTKQSTEEYRNNYDAIFGKKEKKIVNIQVQETKVEENKK